MIRVDTSWGYYWVDPLVVHENRERGRRWAEEAWEQIRAELDADDRRKNRTRRSRRVNSRTRVKIYPPSTSST